MSHRRAWLKTVGVVVLLNAAFLGLAFVPNLLPRDRLLARVRHAFETGQLVERDHLPYNARLGWDQYTDCNILQMLTNRDPSPGGRAFGPLLHFEDTSSSNVCRALRQLARDPTAVPATWHSFRYTRFWHGYLPVVGPVLVVADLRFLRLLLQFAVYASVLLLLAVGVWRPDFLPFTGPVAVGAALFWGLPYFSLGLSHAVGDTVVILGIAGFILGHRRLANFAALLPACATYGALVTYSSMLTGQHVVAAGLLFVVAHLMSRSHDRDHPAFHLGSSFAAVAAFGIGAAMTVIVKLLLTTAFADPSALASFLRALGARTDSVSSDLPIPAFMLPLGRMVRKSTVLTYGSPWLAATLHLSAVSAWIGAIWLAWRAEERGLRSDVLSFVAGATSVPIWTLLVQRHTFEHAFFMTRTLIVPISLGWAALWWQLRARHHDRGRDSR